MDKQSLEQVKTLTAKQEITYFDKNRNVLIRQGKKIVYEKDDRTGEFYPVEIPTVNQICYDQEMYYKTGAYQILAALGLIGNKPIDILIWLIKNANKDNFILATYKRIAEAVNVSEPTIAKLLTNLESYGYIKRISSGVIQLNPSMIMRGNEFKKQTLISSFEYVEPKKREALELAQYSANKNQTQTCAEFMACFPTTILTTTDNENFVATYKTGRTEKRKLK